MSTIPILSPSKRNNIPKNPILNKLHITNNPFIKIKTPSPILSDYVDIKKHIPSVSFDYNVKNEHDVIISELISETKELKLNKNDFSNIKKKKSFNPNTLNSLQAVEQLKLEEKIKQLKNDMENISTSTLNKSQSTISFKTFNKIGLSPMFFPNINNKYEDTPTPGPGYYTSDKEMSMATKVNLISNRKMREMYNEIEHDLLKFEHLSEERRGVKFHDEKKHNDKLLDFLNSGNDIILRNRKSLPSLSGLHRMQAIENKAKLHQEKMESAQLRHFQAGLELRKKQELLFLASESPEALENYHIIMNTSRNWIIIQAFTARTNKMIQKFRIASDLKKRNTMHILIQRWAIGSKDRHYLNSIIKIQRFYRNNRIKRSLFQFLKNKIEKRNQASNILHRLFVTILQSQMGTKLRSRFILLQKKIVLIQRTWRRHRIRWNWKLATMLLSYLKWENIKPYSISKPVTPRIAKSLLLNSKFSTTEKKTRQKSITSNSNKDETRETSNASFEGASRKSFANTGKKLIIDSSLEVEDTKILISPGSNLPTSNDISNKSISPSSNEKLKRSSIKNDHDGSSPTNYPKNLTSSAKFEVLSKERNSSIIVDEHSSDMETILEKGAILKKMSPKNKRSSLANKKGSIIQLPEDKGKRSSILANETDLNNKKGNILIDDKKKQKTNLKISNENNDDPSKRDSITHPNNYFNLNAEPANIRHVRVYFPRPPRRINSNISFEHIFRAASFLSEHINIENLKELQEDPSVNGLVLLPSIKECLEWREIDRKDNELIELMKMEAAELAERRAKEEAIQLDMKRKVSLASVAPNKNPLSPGLSRTKSMLKDFPSDAPSIARNKSALVEDLPTSSNISKLKSLTSTINENYTSNFNTQALSAVIPSYNSNELPKKNVLTNIRSPAPFEISPANFPPLYIRTNFWKTLLATMNAELRGRIKTWENEIDRVKLLTEKAATAQNKLDYRAQIDLILNDSSNSSVNDLLISAKHALIKRNVKINFSTTSIQPDLNIACRPKVKLLFTAAEFDKLRTQISTDSKYNDYNFERSSTSNLGF